MKTSFTFFSVLLLSFFGTVSLAQSTGDYRSIATGNWGTTTTWERFDGVTWVAAPSAPTSADGVITIRSPHTVTIAAAVTADQIVIDAGGRLNNNTAGQNLTLNDGAGDDMTVNGTYLLRANNTLNGPGNVVVSGTFEWFSGTVAAPVTTNTGSTTSISLDFARILNNTFVNGGTIDWSAGPTNGDITFNNGTLTNNGTINASFTGIITRGFVNGAGTNTFNNNGTFNKLTNVTFANNSVRVNNNSTGVIGGIGTFNMSGTITNTGTIRPGNSPGAMTITSSFVTSLATTLAIEVVDGSGAGTGHDQLNVNGNFNVSNAVLNVTQSGTPPFQTYTIVTTTGTVTGTFASTNLPPGYTVNYTPTSIQVVKGSALPAVWGEFTALAKNNTVNLEWTTFREENTSHFIVEYAADGTDFAPIGTVKAQGNASSKATYTFVHSSPDKNKNNLYRIRLVDTDDKVSYSSIRSARFRKGELVLLQAMPNPVVNTLVLQVQENNLQVRIFDFSGRQVQSLLLQKGVHQVDMTRMPAGQYSIIASSKGETVQQLSIIKQ